MKNFRFLFIASLLLVFFFSCKREDPIVDIPIKYGNIGFQFTHNVDGQALVVDTLIYTNAAGNNYMVNEVQYFVSDIVLQNSNGTFFSFGTGSDVHYVDSDISSTSTWSVPDNIPVGSYTSISFTFGLNEVRNISNVFLNPPESNMFWPEFLGGGYHYMKLNGKWIDTASNLSAFNFHLGIGQTYDAVVVDSITGFVQNYFTVTLPNSAFTVREDKTTTVEIIMNMEKWFNTPNVWDFNECSATMQNQTAMQRAIENGGTVFSVGPIQ